MIKKLGTKFCQLEENLLSEQSLKQVKKKTTKTGAISSLKEKEKGLEDSANDDTTIVAKKKIGKKAERKQPKENLKPVNNDQGEDGEDGNGASLSAKRVALPSKNKKN